MLFKKMPVNYNNCDYLTPKIEHNMVICGEVFEMANYSTWNKAMLLVRKLDASCQQYS